MLFMFLDMLMIMKRAEVQSNMRSNKPFVPQTVGISNHMERYLFLARARISLWLLHIRLASLWDDFSLLPSFVSFHIKTDRKSDKWTSPPSRKTAKLVENDSLKSANWCKQEPEKLLNTLINFFPPMRRRDHGGRWGIFYLVKTRPC